MKGKGSLKIDKCAKMPKKMKDLKSMPNGNTTKNFKGASATTKGNKSRGNL